MVGPVLDLGFYIRAWCRNGGVRASYLEAICCLPPFSPFLSEDCAPGQQTGGSEKTRDRPDSRGEERNKHVLVGL